MPTSADPEALGGDERFDLVLGSPPYFPLGSGVEGDHPQKVACRFELRGDIGDYARTAAAHLTRGGLFACVFPEEQRGRVDAAARDASLVIVRRRPVVFREGEPPLVTLFAMSARRRLAGLDARPHLDRAAARHQEQRRQHPSRVRRGEAGGWLSAVAIRYLLATRGERWSPRGSSRLSLPCRRDPGS